MKKIALLLLVLSLLLTLCATVVSCSDDEIPDGMKDVSACADYRFFVPEAWEAQTNSGVSGARVGTLTSGDPDTTNVTVTRYLPANTSESQPYYYWTVLLRPGYVEQYKDFTVLDECKETDENGEVTEGVAARFGAMTGLKYVYTFTYFSVPYKQMQVIAKGPDGYVYIFTYTARTDVEGRDLFAEHQGEVDKMLQEFRFG